MRGAPVCLAVLLAVGSRFSLAYQGSGYSTIEDDEDVYARNRYKDTPWCSPIKVKYGYANCRSPQEGYYKNVLGTKCDIRCQKGYELHGPQELICQSNKRWSGKILCKQKRCPTLSMPPNGGFKCVDGAYFNSRCEYFCSPGYQLKGDQVVQCMDNKVWSGRPASCVDMEPPRIQCPSVKERVAEPNKLTSRVFWDTPEGRDTADGILTDVILKGLPPGSYFSEGDHKIQYTVYDRAGNKGTCKFLVKVTARERCPSKGLNCAITPKYVPVVEFITAADSAIRNNNLPIEEAEQLRLKISTVLTSAQPPPPSLTTQERTALTALSKDETITILSADKGRCTAVLNSADYHNKINSPRLKKLLGQAAKRIKPKRKEVQLSCLNLQIIPPG